MAESAGMYLARIRVYPLKGAAGIDLPDTTWDPFGLVGDRRWMLVSLEGRFLSQRTDPRLCLLRVSITEGSKDRGLPTIAVTGPGAGVLQLRPDVMSRWREVSLHQDRLSALTGDERADRWFSQFLGRPCRIAYFPPEGRRPVDPEFASGHQVAFADGYPLHLTTEESLQDLNRWLPRAHTMLRFRPNLVVRGGVPWEEDEWRVLRIGEAVIRVVKPCARCVVTTVDPGTGARGKEPLRTLRSIRGWEGKTFFGQNAVLEGSGRFLIGQNVHILERGPRRPPLPAS